MVKFYYEKRVVNSKNPYADVIVCETEWGRYDLTNNRDIILDVLGITSRKLASYDVGTKVEIVDDVYYEKSLSSKTNMPYNCIAVDVGWKKCVLSFDRSTIVAILDVTTQEFMGYSVGTLKYLNQE